nr:hypothetical protein [uncultured Desulfuromonas sp.]
MLEEILQKVESLLEAGCINLATDLLAQIMFEWCELPSGGPEPDSPLRALSFSNPHEILFFLRLELENEIYTVFEKPCTLTESREEEDYDFIVDNASTLESRRQVYELDEEAPPPHDLQDVASFPFQVKLKTPSTLSPDEQKSPPTQIYDQIPVILATGAEEDGSDFTGKEIFEEGLLNFDLEEEGAKRQLVLDDIYEGTDSPTLFDDDEELGDFFDDDYFNEIGEGVELTQPLELIDVYPEGRLSIEEKGELVACELAIKYGWENPEEVNFLQKLLSRRGWGQIVITLEKELEDGVDFETLSLAYDFKRLWEERVDWMLAFKKRGWKSELSYSGGRVLSWVASLYIVKVFSNGTTLEELEFFVDQVFDYWFNSIRIKRQQGCFQKYLLTLAKGADCVGGMKRIEGFFYGNAAGCHNFLEVNEFENIEHLSFLREFGLFPDIWLDFLDHSIGAGDVEVMNDY